jgi:hypothetical protein
MRYIIKDAKGVVIRDPQQKLNAVMSWTEERIKEQLKQDNTILKNKFVEYWDGNTLIEYNYIDVFFNNC